MDIYQVIAREAIRDVLLRYARGIDRRDFQLVRSCYHADAFDEHGDDFRGNVEAFVAYAERGLRKYERTMHFLGPPLIELDERRARVETYALALHRENRDDSSRVDHVAGVRYVDRFELGDDWRIAYRSARFEWRRQDPVSGTDDAAITTSDPLDWILTVTAP